jgi:hypothetical protein
MVNQGLTAAMPLGPNPAKCLKSGRAFCSAVPDRTNYPIFDDSRSKTSIIPVAYLPNGAPFDGTIIAH